MLAGALIAVVAIILDPWIVIKNPLGALLVLCSPFIGLAVYLGSQAIRGRTSAVAKKRD